MSAGAGEDLRVAARAAGEGLNQLTVAALVLARRLGRQHPVAAQAQRLRADAEALVTALLPLAR